MTDVNVLAVRGSGKRIAPAYSAELPALLECPLSCARIIGLMTMAPFDSTAEEQKEIFSTLKKLADSHDLPELSMGMSNDYETAAACGSTIVRLGTILF